MRCRSRSPWRQARVNGHLDVPGFGQLIVPTRCWSSAVRDGLLTVGSGVFHPVGFALGEHDGGVVQQPVQDADGGGVFGAEVTPLLERSVGGDRQRAAFVGGGDEPEQQLRAGVIQGCEAHFIDDQQVVADEGVDDLPTELSAKPR